MRTSQQPATSDQQPLSTAFPSLLSACSPFESHPHLAVAVSGGPDSMALLLLAQAWTQARAGKVTALTVDHGLRRESAVEARQVGQWCKQRGIEHDILSVPDSAFSIQDSGVQAAARTARYRLLADWCKAHGVLHLMTAHHRRDQAETLLFRLGRGSDIDGLACMPSVTSLHGIRLLRPLLPVAKSRLVDFLTSAGQPWLDDPSNQNPRYTRNVLRPLITPEASQQAFALTQRLGNVRHRLEVNLAEALAKTVTVYPEGYACIDRAAFVQLPPGIGLRALAHLLVTVSGEEHPPRTEKLERFHQELPGITRRRTLGGCLFIPRRERVLTCREPNAMQDAVQLQPGMRQIWDRRFEVSCTGNVALTVRALGKGGEKKRPKWLERPVFATLPGFWHLEELVAVPHMGYRNPDFREAVCHARFRPVKALAGHAFFSMNKQMD